MRKLTAYLASAAVLATLSYGHATELNYTPVTPEMIASSRLILAAGPVLYTDGPFMTAQAAVPLPRPRPPETPQAEVQPGKPGGIGSDYVGGGGAPASFTERYGNWLKDQQKPRAAVQGSEVP